MMRDLKLPAGATLLPFRLHHLSRMKVHPQQQRVFDAQPNYRAMLQGQAQLGPAYSVLYNDVVWVCFGVAPVCVGVGEVWMIRDYRIDTVAVTFGRAASQFCNQVGPALKLRRLQMIVQVSFPSAVRFAEWLQFEKEGVLRHYGGTNEDHLMMARFYDG